MEVRWYYKGELRLIAANRDPVDINNDNVRPLMHCIHFADFTRDFRVYIGIYER